MVFLVVDTNRFDLFLGLDFFMKIGTVMDVGKGTYRYTMNLGWKWKYCH
jgi:hypothetical protein